MAPISGESWRAMTVSFDFRGYTNAWDRHDGAGVASYFTSEGIYKDLALHEKFEGAAAIEGVVGRAL